jgi:hypothetical protein
MAAGKLPRAPDVVAVLVRDKDGIDVFIVKARASQAGGKLLESKAAIHQEPKGPAAADFYQRGVTGAATAQAFKPQHGGSARTGCVKGFSPYFKSSAIT